MIKPDPAPDPSSIKIPIIYEDEHVVIVNKPAGVVSHPGIGKETSSLSGWFSRRYPEAIHVGDEGRPGIVHRLDKDTSGVMVLAKTTDAFDHLKLQFKKQRVQKEYVALVFGQPGEPKGRITRPLSRSKRNPMRRTVDDNGKPAITEWVKEEPFGDRFTLLRLFPLTGRTHQLRAHLHFLGFPIVGDALYTYKRQKPPQAVTRQLLHAEKITLLFPSGARKTFKAPLAADFEQVLSSLRSSPS